MATAAPSTEATALPAAAAAEHPAPLDSPSASSVAKRPRVEAGVIADAELARGAEGVVTRTTYLGRPAVRKTRHSKPYRHPVLDARLTARRAAAEARALLRLRRAGVRVPAVYAVDAAAAEIVMEFVAGETLKSALAAAATGEGGKVCRAAGEAVWRMHADDVCHGDLTTSNVLALEGGGVALIDFGLSSQSVADEDKAVDLYVLERAIQATYPERADKFLASFMEGYRATAPLEEKKALAVLKRLEDVRSRGRKRDMTG